MALTFERGLWTEAVLNAKANLRVILFVVGVLIAWTVFTNVTGNNSSAVSTIIWLMVIIPAHAKILRGQAGFAALSQKGVFTGFIWRSLLFFVAGLIPAFLTFPLSGQLAGDNWVLFIFLPVYGICQALLLSIWGTWFPSVVADGDKSLAAAWQRGKRTFVYVFLRLIFCNGLILILAFGMLLIFYSFVEAEGPIWSQTTGLDVRVLILVTTFTIAMAVQFVMMATILSRAYLIAEDIKTTHRNALLEDQRQRQMA